VAIFFLILKNPFVGLASPLFLSPSGKNSPKRKKKPLPVSPHCNIFETLNRDFSPQGHKGFLIGPLYSFDSQEAHLGDMISRSCCGFRILGSF